MKYTTMDIAEQTKSLLDSSELCGIEAAQVRELIQRLNGREITVSVIGQFKRGKSTLVNGILEEKLLPVGIVPVTSAVTRIRYGEKSAAVHFENGGLMPVTFEELSDYISEQKNPGNKLGVASVTLHTPSDFLRDSLTFVDTPGVGSVHRHNSDAAYAFIRESDAVIFMLSVDSPINEIEIDFLSRAKDYAAKFYFAVNKIDTVEAGELEVYLDYCQRLLCQLLQVSSVTMFPVSAKSGDGLAQLKDSIQTDCKTAVMEIMDASARKKLADIISRAMTQLKLYWNALNMPTSGFRDRFSEMEKCFESIRERTETSIARLYGEADALEQELKRELDDGLSAVENGVREPESGNAGLQRLPEKWGVLYRQGIGHLNYGCRKLSNGLELSQNEMKQELSASVSQLFGMEYHYELTELNLGEQGGEKESDETGTASQLFLETSSLAGKSQSIADVDKLMESILSDYNRRLENQVKELAETFRGAAERLCDELSAALGRILLYREQNAYTVARRIEDLNILIRQLKKRKAELQPVCREKPGASPL